MSKIILSFEFKQEYILPIAIGAVAVFLLIFILVKIKNRGRKYSVMLNNLERQRDNLLLIPIQTKLNRLEKIGQNNISFAELYKEYTQSYNDICNELNEMCIMEMDHCKKELANREYQILVESIKAFKNKLAAFKERLDILNGNVSLSCKDDDELKEKQKVLDIRISSLKNQAITYSNTSLKFMKDELNDFFKEFDKSFEVFNEYALRGNYVDAKEVLFRIDEKLRNLENNFRVLVQASEEVSINIPDLINKLIKEYNNMAENMYPLNQIPAAKTISECKEEWKEVIYKLKAFDFNDVDILIISIREKIKHIYGLLDDEKSSRENFEAEYDPIYNRAIELDSTYIKRIKDDADYKKKFEQSEERSALDYQLKQENQKLSLLKSSLDALSYGGQPYSYRYKKLKELQKQCDTFETYLTKSKDNYSDLEKSSNSSIDLLEFASVSLRKSQLILRNSRMDRLVSKYQDDFERAFTMINRLNTLLETKPIDVERVKKVSDDLKSLVEFIITESQNDVKLVSKAEDLILYANNYRGSDINVQQTLPRAESLFYDGRYKESINEVLKILSNKSIPKELL